jgi:hypothetical protein
VPTLKDLLKIQTDGAHDELIRGEALVDDIRVIHDIAAEDKASANSEYDVHRGAEGDKDADHTGHHCEGY